MNRVENHVRGRPAERRLAAKQLIENRAQAILVARRQHAGLPLSLFRGDIGRSTQDHAGRKGNLARVRAIGDPEIHEINCTFIVETDVGWLDVTVDDALSLRICQSLSQFGDDFRGAREALSNLRPADPPDCCPR